MRFQVIDCKHGRFEIKTAEDTEIAVVKLQSTIKKTKALAHMLAAAPELLAACKAALENFPDEMRGSLVEAAIAKAEGKKNG